MKKAQGLPISTIIIAALGILVLVIIAAIFGSQITRFGKSANECPGRCIGELTVSDLKTAIIQQELCNPGEKALSAWYVKPGQAGTADLKYCAVCCLATG